MPNPPIDEVMSQVIGTIRSNCEREIDPVAFDEFLVLYKPAFAARLEVADWDRDKPNVLNAARLHGVLANTLAELSRRPRVDKNTLLRASMLVEEHCVLAFQEGIWCSRVPR